MIFSGETSGFPENDRFLRRNIRICGERSFSPEKHQDFRRMIIFSGETSGSAENDRFLRRNIRISGE